MAETTGNAANKADAILRQVRMVIAAEHAHAVRGAAGLNTTRDDVDMEYLCLLDFTCTDCDEALRIVRRRATLTAENTRLREELDAMKAERDAAAEDVIAERRRQINAEGWTPEHDDQHVDGQMAKAAGFYAAPRHPAFWPWAWSWFKPTTRRRDLVKAGALILAEIERLDRAALRALANKEKPNHG